jgi:hypothetical protein
LNLGLDLIVNSFIQEVIFNILIVVGVLKIMIIQGARLMGAQLSSRDQFRDWRLDVDNMSYEVSSLSSNVFYFLFLNCE